LPKNKISLSQVHKKDTRTSFSEETNPAEKKRKEKRRRRRSRRKDDTHVAEHSVPGKGAHIHIQQKEAKWRSLEARRAMRVLALSRLSPPLHLQRSDVHPPRRLGRKLAA
jgi:hypothetical protein